MKQFRNLDFFIIKIHFQVYSIQFARLIFHEILKNFFRKCFAICFTNRNWMQVGKTEFFLLLRKMSFSYVWCLCTMIPLEKIMNLNQRHLLIFPLISQENQRCITGISPPSNETIYCDLHLYNYNKLLKV